MTAGVPLIGHRDVSELLGPDGTAAFDERVAGVDDPLERLRVFEQLFDVIDRAAPIGELVEVLVGPRCRVVLRPAQARWFASQLTQAADLAEQLEPVDELVAFVDWLPSQECWICHEQDPKVVARWSWDRESWCPSHEHGEEWAARFRAASSPVVGRDSDVQPRIEQPAVEPNP